MYSIYWLPRCKYFPMVDFKLQTGRHGLWSWEEMCLISSPEPVWAGVSQHTYLQGDQRDVGKERAKLKMMEVSNLDDSLDVNGEGMQEEK